MQRRNRPNDTALPPPLLQPTPRQARLNGSGIVTLVVALGLIVAGSCGAAVAYRRARLSEQQAARIASEGAIVRAQVIQVERRGRGDESRARVHYRYVVAGVEHTGRGTVRRQDRARLERESDVAVRYLTSEPGTSWIEGYEPRRWPAWPAFVLPPVCLLGAVALARLLRRQSSLLSHGRGALARVTKLEKKRTDNGTAWRVHYEWRLLSGARRQGRYTHGGKQPPAVGAAIPIVYDRDEPSRHSKYPLALIRLPERAKRTA